LRQHRLLDATSRERGSAPVESTLAFVFILVLVLGVIEVGFSLYGRNVVLASAHEGARAAVEFGRSPEEAAAIAEQTVRRSAGSLVDDLAVRVSTSAIRGASVVSVRVVGVVDAFGPVPFRMHVDTVASATKEEPPG
jgi:Flp pilus assembly protein TadG